MHLAQLLDPLLRCTNVKVMVPRLPDAPYAVLERLRWLWLRRRGSAHTRRAKPSFTACMAVASRRFCGSLTRRGTGSGITTYPITSHG
jgi:hypothetical protein